MTNRGILDSTLGRVGGILFLVIVLPVLITEGHVMLALLMGVGFVLWIITMVAGPDQLGPFTTESNDTDHATDENPVAVLRRRYANGEIDNTEFEDQLERILETESIEQQYEQQESESISEQS